MLDLKDKEFFEKRNGKAVDFYLEDDMFEIEGKIAMKDGEAHIEVVYAVGHMLKIAGNELKIGEKYGKLTASRIEDGKTFDLEINRVYTALENPKVEDFKTEFECGVRQFFNKLEDTLVWYETKKDKWFMEVNKINMFCSGDIHEFDSLEEMFQKADKYLSGKWQCIYFSAEVEEDEVF
ncbi:MAG: hypothetical protein RR495_05665 [Anaerovoracaceae bacterium]